MDIGGIVVRLQPRDLMILREIAMHGVMSRDQVVALGFFRSIPRANARLCPLTALGLLARLSGLGGLQAQQSIYTVASKASPYLDERVANLVLGRKQTVRFIEHSLMVVDIRVQLKRLGADGWNHECQVRHRYQYSGIRYEFRPDGLAYVGHNCLFIEADRGNASRKALSETFASYDRYALSGQFEKTYGKAGFRVLVVTSGKRRADSVRRIATKYRVAISVTTLETLGHAKSLREVLL